MRGSARGLPVADPIQTEGIPDSEREALAQRFQGVINDVRSRRLFMEDEWLKAHDAWIGVQTYTFYESEFKHFIPAFRRTIERTVSRTMQQLMPHYEFYQMFPGDEADAQADIDMKPVHRYMDWLLLDFVKIRKVARQLVRTFYLYSRCITKTTVRVIDIPKITEGKVTGSVQQVWPTTRAVDPFTFYVWPETATDIEDATLVFEDVIMPYQEYAESVRLGLADPINQDELRPPIYPFHIAQRMDRIGMTTPEAVRSGEPGSVAKQHFVQLSEVYFRGGGNRWLMGWLVWNVQRVRFTRLQFSRYPKPPYRMAVARELPSQHYTPGMGQDIEALQVLLNDQFNQGEESRAVSSGPPVILDPTKVRRADSFIFGYRRKWYGDPTGVKMMEIPDTSVSAFRAAQFTLAYMEGSGPTGLSAGQPPRGTPRGSGAVSQLMAMAGADVVDAAQIIEEECLSPTIQDLYDLTVAFVPDLQIVKIPGAEGYAPMMATMNELFGHYTFKWFTSNRFQDKQNEAQLGLQFYQQLAHVAPDIANQGFKINWAHISRVMFKDILGERRLADVIQPMTPEERQQHSALLQQQAAAASGNKAPGPKAAAGGSPTAP